MRRGRLAPLALLNLVLAGALLAAVVFVVTPMAFAISAAAGAVLVGLGRLALRAVEGDQAGSLLKRAWPLQAAVLLAVGLQIVSLVVAAVRLLGVQHFEPALLLLLAGIVTGVNLAWRRRLWAPLLEHGVDLASGPVTAVLLLAGVLLLRVYLRADLTGGGDVYVADSFHPTYELSIARASLLGFPLRDLSYLGKEVSYHFLPLMPLSVLVDRLGADELTAVYRVFPSLGALGLTLGLLCLAREVGIGRWPSVAAAAAIWLVSPSLPGLVTGPFSTGYQPFLHRATFMVGYSVSFQALAAVLVLWIAGRSRPRLLLLAVPLASSLLLSRGPFFVTLMLGLGALALLETLVARSWRPLVPPALTGLLALPLTPFLRESHTQLQWAVGPAMWIYGWGDTTAVETAWGFGLSALLNPYYLAGLLVVPLAAGLGWLAWRRAEVLGALARRGDEWTYAGLALVAVSLGGLAVPTVVVDTTEYAVYQFFLPAILGLWLFTFWYLGACPSLAAWLARRRSLAFATCVLVVLLSTGRHLLVEVRQVAETRRPDLTTDLVGALRALRAGSPDDAVVLFGQHYQDRDWSTRSHSAQWFGWWFTRSAISGRQAVVEGSVFKGVSVQPDFPERMLENLRFYHHAVERNGPLLAGWDVPPPASSPPVPTQARRAMLIRRLWLAPHFNAYDAADRLRETMGTRWGEVLWRDRAAEDVLAWMRGYVARHGVDYVVLENGERPKAAVIEALGLREAQTYGSVTVYRLDPAGGQ